MPPVSDATHQRDGAHGSELGTTWTMQLLAEHRQRDRVLPTIGSSGAQPDRRPERQAARDVVVRRVTDTHISVHAYLANESKNGSRRRRMRFRAFWCGGRRLGLGR